MCPGSIIWVKSFVWPEFGDLLPYGVFTTFYNPLLWLDTLLWGAAYSFGVDDE
jgi:hypothetical protein